MKVLRLADLGEGLQEAEIVRWHVAVGEEVRADQTLVSVETAKAIVEIPSPYAGRVLRLCGEPGELLQVGDPLVEFEGSARDVANAGAVVGRIEATGEVLNEPPASAGRATPGLRAVPAVRALARRLDVDLSAVSPSGPNDMITAADVQRVSRILKEFGPLEPLRGVRRVMAQRMARAHGEVATVTVSDDADVSAWGEAESIMLRLIRAVVAGCRAEPGLNAWYDSHAMGRRVLERIDLGIAVDTEDGLIVPVLRNVGNREREDLQRGLDAIKRDVRKRIIPPEELRENTLTLSNFGSIGGRYADPVVMPPTVAILGAGKLRDQVVPAKGEIVIHPILPLSLSFDHRCVTGGEATRFLGAVVRDLELAE